MRIRKTIITGIVSASLTFSAVAQSISANKGYSARPVELPNQQIDFAKPLPSWEEVEQLLQTEQGIEQLENEVKDFNQATNRAMKSLESLAELAKSENARCQVHLAIEGNLDDLMPLDRHNVSKCRKLVLSIKQTIAKAARLFDAASSLARHMVQKGLPGLKTAKQGLMAEQVFEKLEGETNLNCQRFSNAGRHVRAIVANEAESAFQSAMESCEELNK